MQNKNLKELVFLAIIIIISLLPTAIISIKTNLSQGFDSENAIEIKRPDNSGHYTASFIHIQYDNWTDNGNGVFQRAGTESDPHLIQDVIVDSIYSGSCIIIQDCREYFKIPKYAKKLLVFWELRNKIPDIIEV